MKVLRILPHKGDFSFSLHDGLCVRSVVGCWAVCPVEGVSWAFPGPPSAPHPTILLLKMTRESTRTGFPPHIGVLQNGNSTTQCEGVSLHRSGKMAVKMKRKHWWRQCIKENKHGGGEALHRAPPPRNRSRGKASVLSSVLLGRKGLLLHSLWPALLLSVCNT